MQLRSDIFLTSVGVIGGHKHGNLHISWAIRIQSLHLWWNFAARIMVPLHPAPRIWEHLYPQMKRIGSIFHALEAGKCCEDFPAMFDVTGGDIYKWSNSWWMDVNSNTICSYQLPVEEWESYLCILKLTEPRHSPQTSQEKWQTMMGWNVVTMAQLLCFLLAVHPRICSSQNAGSSAMDGKTYGRIRRVVAAFLLPFILLFVCWSNPTSVLNHIEFQFLVKSLTLHFVHRRVTVLQNYAVWWFRVANWKMTIFDRQTIILYDLFMVHVP